MSAFENIASFAGGFTQGVPQGLNLYEQFEQTKQKGKERRQQAETEAFVAKLAQEGKFKTDKIGAFKEIANFKFNQGDADTGQKILDYTTGLTKEKGTLSFMYAGSIGKHDPTAALEHYNEGLKLYGLADQYKVNRTPEGGLLVSGMQGGTPFNKPMSDDEFDNFLHTSIVGLTLGPKEAAEEQRDERQLQGQLAVAGANVEQSRAATAKSQNDMAIALAEQPARMAEIGARTSALQTSAQLDQARLRSEEEGRPTELLKAQAAINRDLAAQRNSEIEAKASEYKLGEAQAGRADDTEINELVKTMLPEPDTSTMDPDMGAAALEKVKGQRITAGTVTDMLVKANRNLTNDSAFAATIEMMNNPAAYSESDANGVVTDLRTGNRFTLPPAADSMMRTYHGGPTVPGS